MSDSKETPPNTDLPPGFRPVTARKPKLLDAAVEAFLVELDEAAAAVVSTGEMDKSIALLKRVIRPLLASADLTTSEDPMFRRVFALLDKYKAGKDADAIAFFDERLVDARKLLDFARSAVGGLSANGTSCELSEDAMFKLLELAGVGNEPAPSPMEAALQSCFPMVKAHLDKRGTHTHTHAPAPEPYDIPDVAEAPIDSADVLRSLLYLYEDGRIDGAGEIDEELRSLLYLYEDGRINEAGEIDEELWVLVLRASAAKG